MQSEDVSRYVRAAWVALQNQATAQVLRAFSDGSVPVLVFKGMALRGRVYVAPEQRLASDVDLLVRRADWDRAGVLLDSLGYQLSPGKHDWTAGFTREFMGEAPYRKGALVFDLHWHLTAMSWFRCTTCFDLEALWRRALPIEIEGASALRLCPEDELLHLCFHTAVHHGLAHPYGVRDILGVLRLEGNALDWAVLARRAREWRVSVAVWAALCVARERDEALIPVRALEALHVPPWRQALLRPFVRHAVEGKSALISGTMRFLGVLLVDRVRDLPVVVLRGLFPGQRWLQLRYDLSPRQAFWRQFFYPLEVFTRGLGTLVRVAMCRL